MPLPPTRYIDAGPGVPLARPGVAMAQGEAMARMGETISQIGDKGFEIAERARKFEEAGKTADFFRQRNEEAAQFSNELLTRSDTSNWGKDFQEKASSWNDGLQNLGLSPAGLERAKGELADWSSRQKIHFETQAAVKSVEMGQAQVRLRVEDAMKIGDYGEARRGIEHGVASGVWNPAEAAIAHSKVNESQAVYDVSQDIDSNPLGTFSNMSSRDEFMKSHPGLTLQAYESLQSHAETSANKFRADYANNLIISGQNPTADELADMAKRGLIDSSTHAKWVSNQRQNPSYDPALYEENFSAVMSYDMAKDPSGSGEAQLRSGIAASALPKESKEILNAKLSERLNPTKSNSPKGKLETEFGSKLTADFNHGEFGQFRFLMDHDKDPSTAMQPVLNNEEYTKAWKSRGEFAERWRQRMEAMPEDANFDQFNQAYDELRKEFKERKPVVKISFNTPSALPFNTQSTYQAAKGGATFGGQVVNAPGVPYRNAAVSVFGGTNDPADNGESAFGGKTGPGAREGAAIPEKLLSAKFPDRDKAWLADNVRVVARSPNGVMHTLALADKGTAESVWVKNGSPTLDLTEGAVTQMGGRTVYDSKGKQSGVKGIDSLDFAVVSIDTGSTKLAGNSWEKVKSAWFTVNRPTGFPQAENSLIALRDAWHHANASQVTR